MTVDGKNKTSVGKCVTVFAYLRKKRNKNRNEEAFDPKLISSIKWFGLICHFFDGALQTFEVTGNSKLLLTFRSPSFQNAFDIFEALVDAKFA